MIKEELYELTVEDNEDGVFAVSFVESPAIERDFIFFGKEVNFQAVSEEKMLVAGPLLVPNKKILRIDGEGKPYYVFFTPETIEKIARKFMKNKYNDAVTVEHDRKVSGIHLTESWLIEQSAKDKSNLYGFTLPRGSWFGVYDVSGNPKVWEQVKDGTFKGFSVEALLEHKKSDLKLSMVEKPIEDLTEEEATIVLSQIKALIKKDKRYKSKQRVEMESFSDYGDGVKNNAKRALDWADKNGWGSCGTPVGKQRANQLAKGEAISVDTIKRMYSFLSRHEKDLETSTAYGDGCGKLMYDAWGGKAGLGWSRNKLRELGLLNLEAQPSVSSTYPGEAASGSISPALLAEDCPEATQSIPVNLENRQKAIDQANYGPLNPNELNGVYWKKKADMFKGDVESAKKALCGNCAFFLQTQKILDCIAEGIGGEVKDEWDTIEAGNLGYCEAFDFKCAANRTCDAWVVGGPITD